MSDGVWKMAIPPKVLALPLIPGIVLSNIGAAKTFDGTTLDVSAGYTYLKAGTCLYTAVFGVVAVIAIYNVLLANNVERDDRRLLHLIDASLPFLGVLMVYRLICVFTRGWILVLNQVFPGASGRISRWTGHLTRATRDGDF